MSLIEILVVLVYMLPLLVSLFIIFRMMAMEQGGMPVWSLLLITSFVPLLNIYTLLVLMYMVRPN